MNRAAEAWWYPLGMNRVTRLILLVGTVVAMCGLTACTRNHPSAELAADEDSRPVAALVIASGEYTRAFAASRDVLRDFGFALERVDAQTGVITTQQRGTGGVVTPWDSMQSTFAQELEDAGQRHRRVARLEFAAMDGSGGIVSGAATPPDLRRYPGPVEVRAWVDVYRWHQTQLQLNTINIRDSSYAIDTDLEARGMTSYGVAHAQDPALAERIILALRQAMGSDERIETVPTHESAAAPMAEQPEVVEPAAPAAIEPVPAQQPAPVSPTNPAPAAPPAQEPEWKKGEPIHKP